MRALSMELTEACRYLFLFNGEKIRVGNLVILCTGQGKGALWSVLSHWPSEVQWTFYSGSPQGHSLLQIMRPFGNTYLPAWYHSHLMAVELSCYNRDSSGGFHSRWKPTFWNLVPDQKSHREDQGQDQNVRTLGGHWSMTSDLCIGIVTTCVEPCW